jgi:hypothetical protein
MWGTRHIEDFKQHIEDLKIEDFKQHIEDLKKPATLARESGWRPTVFESSLVFFGPQLGDDVQVLERGDVAFDIAAGGKFAQ